MTEQDKTKQIQRLILMLTETLLNRHSMTWNDVETIYASGDHPEVNKEIDYIIKGV